MLELYEHQKDAIERLRNGSILVGGVGSGKSRTGLAFFYLKVCEGKLKINGVGGHAPMKGKKDLYIITTAFKRDKGDWEEECKPFGFERQGVGVTVDSWNNIKKYTDVKHAFFIFDENRLSGYGMWAKSFIEICKNNEFIVLTATPGDKWMDYCSVFIANGFYKNKAEFIRRHVVFNNYTTYPVVDHYVDTARLIHLRDGILVDMPFTRNTIAHDETIITDYDKGVFNQVLVERWDPYHEKPIKDIVELCYMMRKVVNSDPSRMEAVKGLMEKHPKMIIFYNFDFELYLLLEMAKEVGVAVTQRNGHKHEDLSKEDRWLYLVQYFSGAEGWNCIQTNVIVFYSQNYSYKTMIQAAGRIDRLNTPFSDLYYYYLRSNSTIDLSIQKALVNKRVFNEARFFDI